MNKSVCFVIMPFGASATMTGARSTSTPSTQEIIAPAIGEVGFEAVRADDELSGGVIHNAMFERLVLSEYAIADLTILNPNVYYELGVRHAVRPQSTVLISAADCLPFDVAHLSTTLYALDKKGRPKDADAARGKVAQKLEHAKKNDQPDSPLFRYAEGWLKAPQVDHEKTDLFRRDVSYSREFKTEAQTRQGIGRRQGRRRAGRGARGNPRHRRRAGGRRHRSPALLSRRRGL